MNGDGTDEYYRLMSDEGWLEPEKCPTCGGRGIRTIKRLIAGHTIPHDVPCSGCTPENVEEPTDG